ncbi:hypothetical protein GDO81_013834 [Engystomops pustulosus]|uniref:Uncharacterized protein n=1 Tax=Engystomops pustulosus TaxID=76066 RepID=A0AAV7B5V6_ENGPU|nr:hypothetical protein GDO81_013834 [Engystomops pustulosus]
MYSVQCSFPGGNKGTHYNYHAWNPVSGLFVFHGLNTLMRISSKPVEVMGHCIHELKWGGLKALLCFLILLCFSTWSGLCWSGF